MSCLACGAHGRGHLVGERWSCEQCDEPRYLRPRPLLIVSGAAAAGKSAVGAMLAANAPGVLALDIDVMATGAAAVAGQPDYHAFWAYLLEISREIHQNQTDVVWCGICRPAQVAEQPADSVGAFSSIEMLVLSCDDEIYRQRLLQRPGGDQAASRADFHVALNAELRAAQSVGPVRLAHLDTSELTVEQTQSEALMWVQSQTSAPVPIAASDSAIRESGLLEA